MYRQTKTDYKIHYQYFFMYARDGINDDLKAPPFTMFPM